MRSGRRTFRRALLCLYSRGADKPSRDCTIARVLRTLWCNSLTSSAWRSSALLLAVKASSRSAMARLSSSWDITCPANVSRVKAWSSLSSRGSTSRTQSVPSGRPFCGFQQCPSVESEARFSCHQRIVREPRVLGCIWNDKKSRLENCFRANRDCQGGTKPQSELGFEPLSSLVDQVDGLAHASPPIYSALPYTNGVSR
jgi:hypothetical protein